jgi:hypothetical protein
VSRGHASQFEPSGESPENVATVAISSCSAEKKAYVDAMTACMDNPYGSAMGDALDKAGHDRAVEMVVKIRAEHHAPN